MISGPVASLARPPRFTETLRAAFIVTVQVDGRALVPNASTAATANTLEVALMAIDSTGKIQAATGSAIPIELDAAATRILRESGYRAVSRVQVPPGRYQVRVAVRERAGGQRGAVHASVDVPDYYNGKVEMSGLLLTSERTALVPTSIDRETNERMPLLPIVQRRFSTGDELTAALEVYDSSRRPDLDVTTTLVDAAGKELFRATSEVGPEDFKVLGGAYVYSVQVPLDRATEGAQLLVEARPASSGHKPVVRRVSLSVTPSAQGPESSRP